MRRSFLITFLIIPLWANAQFSKGDKVLGGAFSIFLQDAPDSQNGGLVNEVKRFSIMPSIGFFINEKFAVGGQLGYASSNQRIANSSSSVLEFNSKSFTIGVSGNRYFKISDRFLFSILGQFNFARGFDTDADFDPMTGEAVQTKTHNHKLTTSIRPNFLFFPSPKWGIEAGIGSVSHTFSRSHSNDEKANIFSANYGTMTFGIAYYFRRSSQN